MRDVLLILNNERRSDISSSIICLVLLEFYDLNGFYEKEENLLVEFYYHFSVTCDAFATFFYELAILLDSMCNIPENHEPRTF